jgi:hypothetical protein
MIVPEYQPEYIIPDSLIEEVKVYLPTRADYLLEKLRSRRYDTDSNAVLDLLDTFVKASIKYCDKPHGKMSLPDKVIGLKVGLEIIEGVIEQCRTPEGRSEVRKSLIETHSEIYGTP